VNSASAFVIVSIVICAALTTRLSYDDATEMILARQHKKQPVEINFSNKQLAVSIL
jgi:hypothetical protein